MAEVLDEEGLDYFCTVRDDLAVATWSFDRINRSLLAGSERREKASIGVYVSATFPSGAYGEKIEEPVVVDAGNFKQNVLQAYKRAKGYGVGDLEVNQAQRF